MSREGWSDGEVQATVADYFEMLRTELSGNPYSKTAHRDRLLATLDGRSPAAVERKHQNISAILLEEGLPAIDGYKPLGNYQGALRTEVLRSIQRDPDLLRLIRSVEAALPAGDSSSALDVEDVLVPAPERRETLALRQRETDWRGEGRHYDFELRDQRIRTLGRAGEEFVLRFEKSRLAKLGRPDLANKVEWVSSEVGEGTGFDVLSWDERERSRELFVEVKTTNFSRYQPFVITRGEVAFSASHAEQYSLYRVFNFRLRPKLFSLAGSVEDNVRLEPCLFEGRI